MAHVANPEETIPADLIYSTVSWGHHYPIGRYMGLVRRSLRPGGTIIVDLRRKDEESLPAAYPELLEHFEFVAWIHTGRKYRRSVWRHPE